MCVVSAVHDYGLRLPQDTWTLPGVVPSFEKLIEEARKFDKAAKQPDCVDPMKERLIERIRHMETPQDEGTRVTPAPYPADGGLKVQVRPVEQTQSLDDVLRAERERLDLYRENAKLRTQLAEREKDAELIHALEKEVVGLQGEIEMLKRQRDDLGATAGKATQELAEIDAVLARRSALDDCKTRAEKVQRAIAVAAQADGFKADAERASRAESDAKQALDSLKASLRVLAGPGPLTPRIAIGGSTADAARKLIDLRTGVVKESHRRLDAIYHGVTPAKTGDPGIGGDYPGPAGYQPG